MQRFYGYDMVAIKEIAQTYSRNLPLLPQRRDQLQKNQQLRLLF